MKKSASFLIAEGNTDIGVDRESREDEVIRNIIITHRSVPKVKTWWLLGSAAWAPTKAPSTRPAPAACAADTLSGTPVSTARPRTASVPSLTVIHGVTVMLI